MAAQLRKFSPEGRALLRALNQWKEAGRLHRKMKQAAAAIKYRHARAGLNSWAAAAGEMAERRERMAAALYKMSPEGRAKAKAFNKMTAGMEVWRLMRKGLAALAQRQTRAALNGWYAKEGSPPSPAPMRFWSPPSNTLQVRLRRANVPHP